MAASTQPRKRAPRRTASAGPAAEVSPTQGEFDAELRALAVEAGQESPIGEDGSITAVRIGKRGRTPNPVVDLFDLDGVMYQIPSRPSPAMLMVFFREARNKRIGTSVATENLLMNMIGEEAMAALVASPEVTEQDMADILTIVGRVAFGTLAKVGEAAGPS